MVVISWIYAVGYLWDVYGCVFRGYIMLVMSRMYKVGYFGDI